MLLLSLIPKLLPLLALIALTLATTEDLYKILGLDRSCSERDMKKAYRTLAKKYHPDKSSGDEKKFLEVTEAFEALSDPTTRKIYDQYGHDGLANHKRGGQEEDKHTTLSTSSHASLVAAGISGEGTVAYAEAQTWTSDSTSPYETSTTVEKWTSP